MIRDIAPARVILLAISLLASAWATSCSFDERANAAKGCGSCPPGMCYFGFCVADTSTSPVTGSGGSGVPNGGSGGSDQGSTGTSGQGGVAGSGGKGTGSGGHVGGTGGNGGGSGGSHPTPDVCPDGSKPEDETCNGKDDDCDGATDEDVRLGSCAAQNGGTCGGVLRCQDGKSVCEAKDGPTPEVCNGEDDDCDGVVDNDSDVPCYPDGSTGCTKKDDGSYDCVGLCKSGMSTCQNGMPSACTDYVGPAAEQCGQADAADEDCNGKVDDGCPCTGNQTQSCYSGPAFTSRIGTCHAGTQHCVNSVFGPCEGEVVPATETCQNQGADDDCDLITDDVFLAGFYCNAFGQPGACANGAYGCKNGSLVCLPGQPARTETSCDGVDEDCDGRTDENFDLQNDENNCGSCGKVCPGGNLCCNGVCRNPDTDQQHCGSCTRACTGDTLCCSGSCVGTNTNDHCGSCGGCGGGSTCCAKACVATNTMAHCGSCAPCTLDACCDGACVQTDSNDHCGACGGCGNGTSCCKGTCVPSGAGLCNDCSPCPVGQLCCGGTCVGPSGDAGVVCP
jgi:hypothetical protein